MAVSILIAERQEMFGDTLCLLLESETDMTVCGRTADAREILPLCASLHPHVVVLDADMMGLGCADIVRRIQQGESPPAAVCVSLHEDGTEADVFLRAGAAAYLGKDSTPAQLTEAIRKAARGVACTVPRYGRRPRAGGTSGPTAGTPADKLTMREREILRLLAEGRVGKEIADLLKISVKTVSTHRVHIGDKLGTRNIAFLTKYALRQGLAQV